MATDDPDSAPGAPPPAADSSEAGDRPSTRRSTGQRRAARLAPLLVVGLLAGIVGVMIGAAAGERTAPAPDDVGFVNDMLDHHAQAVLLSEFVLAQSEHPVVRAMASQIVSDQRYEIGWMEGWLRANNQTRADADRTVMAWMAMPLPHDQMPGLVPHEEIVAFYNLDGEALDREFLALMRAHHEGGVHMADWEAQWGVDADLRDLAERMVVKQRTEINDIDAMLG